MSHLSDLTRSLSLAVNRMRRALACRLSQKKQDAEAHAFLVLFAGLLSDVSTF